MTTDTITLTGDEPRMNTFQSIGGRPGISVKGPAGNFLITDRDDRRPGRQLWRSDALTTIATAADDAPLVERALKLAADTTHREVVIVGGAVLNAWTRTTVPGTTRHDTDDAARAAAEAAGWRVLPFWPLNS